MIRPRTIYISTQVYEMLKVKQAIDEAAGGVRYVGERPDEFTDNLLFEMLNKEPYMAEYLRLQKESRDNFERSVAELVKARK